MKKRYFYFISIILAIVGILLFIYPSELDTIPFIYIYFILPSIYYFIIAYKLKENSSSKFVSVAGIIQIISFVFIAILLFFGMPKCESMGCWALGVPIIFAFLGYLILSGLSLFILMAYLLDKYNKK